MGRPGKVLAAALVLFGVGLGALGLGAREPADYSRCQACHQGLEPIGPGHEALACADCHLGPSPGPLRDHDPIRANPSAPQDAPQACGRCHPAEVEAVEASPHRTCRGLIGQTRYLWGAQASPEGGPPAKDLPLPPAEVRSPADLLDDLLRRRCLRCHLGTRGPGGRGLFRAEGCAACHTPYAADGLSQSRDPTLSDGRPGRAKVHRLRAKTAAARCQACHNGPRVGADYNGFFEHDFDWSYRSPLIQGFLPERPWGLDQHRLVRDVHAEKGMTCTDCHTGDQVMGLAPGGKPSCRACHGGPESGPQQTSRAGPARAYNPEGPAHGVPAHARVRCSACHAAWSFQDYGLDLLRLDFPDYEPWRRLFIQGDTEGERFFKAQLARRPEEREGPVSTDWLSGETRPGLWLAGWRFRRWEWLPLGRDKSGRVAVLRPHYQYRVSFVDRQGRVILDGVVPERGDGSGPGWAFAPYTPHTVRPQGRACEACHHNPIAAGLGLFSEQEARGEAGLTRPAPLIRGVGRRLTPAEQDRLVHPGLKYRLRRAELLREEAGER